MEFLSLLKENNVKSAIATSAPRENVDFVMTEASILYPFDVIIDASNVSQAKPSPEIYLKTAQSLKTDPEKCIVFEDSRTGIESALNAGMKVVALTTSMTREELNHVHHVIDDFTEINLEILTNLM